MNEDRQPSLPASVWNRFWSPRAYVETLPVDASTQEVREISLRNAMWLRTHMDIYILRWGVLWASTVVLAIAATSEIVPDVLCALAFAATFMSSWGLGAMLRIYRRATKAIRQ